MIVCIPDVLDQATLKGILDAIDEGEFVDGRTTAGFRAKQVKNNQQMKRGDEQAEVIKDRVVAALRGNRQFRQAAQPKVIQRPLISKYEPGMAYGSHVDDAIMGPHGGTRTDVSTTVFLSDPDEYEGGELVIEQSIGELRVKLPAGSAVVYPSGDLHHVAPVTKGVRLAAVTWIQSLIRDPRQREILYDVDTVRRSLADQDAQSRDTNLAYKTYANLLRLWAES